MCIYTYLYNIYIKYTNARNKIVYNIKMYGQQCVVRAGTKVNKNHWKGNENV